MFSPRRCLGTAVLLLAHNVAGQSSITLSFPASSPTPTATPTLGIYPLINSFTCQPLTVQWFWNAALTANNSNPSIALQISNTGVPQDTPGASGSIPPTPNPGVNATIQSAFPLTAQSFMWPSVTVPAGWYVVNAWMTPDQVGFAQSPRFQIATGPDTSCLISTAAAPSPAIPSSAPTAVVPDPDPSTTLVPAALAASHAKLGKGAIAGLAVGVALGVAAIIAALLYMCRRNGRWLNLSGSPETSSPTHALAGWKTTSGATPQRPASRSAPGRTSAPGSLRRDSDNSTLTAVTDDSWHDTKMVDSAPFTMTLTTVPPLPSPPPTTRRVERKGSQNDEQSPVYSRHSYSHSRSHSQLEAHSRRSVDIDSIGNIRNLSRAPSARYVSPSAYPNPTPNPNPNSSSNSILKSNPASTPVAAKPSLSRRNSGASTGNKLARKPVPAYVPSPFDEPESAGTGTDGEHGFTSSSAGSASTLAHVGAKFNGNFGGSGNGVASGRPGFKFAGEKAGPVHYLIPDPPAPQRD
ncbi:hypothetical protein BOTBODRAFT_36164 [Botryobasidium botryosum FD-172 SS1]|uniref:Mid2 domain-containing protein n=1 Tax=Botryobasidium botryosum (strain FD-172 SS1) TaxID=930990 RepID=A0A067M3W5_BOTB1|nr:hypothetical protein BOTBODRAFT_36164 [Botryobasidium botryosum FD-172 SS1]